MPYRVINIYYSVTCYTNHINSTRIQSIASIALMVFPDAPPPFESPVSHWSWGSALLMSQSFGHSLPTAGSLLSLTTHLFGPLATPTHNLPPASQFRDIPLLGSPWHSLDRKNPSSSCQSVPSISSGKTNSAI